MLLARCKCCPGSQNQCQYQASVACTDPTEMKGTASRLPLASWLSACRLSAWANDKESYLSKIRLIRYLYLKPLRLLLHIELPIPNALFPCGRLAYSCPTDLSIHSVVSKLAIVAHLICTDRHNGNGDTDFAETTSSRRQYTIEQG